MPRNIEKDKGKLVYRRVGPRTHQKYEGKLVFEVNGNVIPSPEKIKRKPGRPKKHPVKELVPEAKREDICSSCGKPLVFDRWNTAGTIGFCDNVYCTRFHQPQGWRSSGKIVKLEEKIEEAIYG